FEVQAKPGVKNFLQNLRKHHIPMVIATTGDRELLKTALKRLSLEPYFLEILTCTEFHTSKKYPYIYEKASDRLGTNPEQTFVFEDVLHAVASAAKGGFVTVAVEDAASHADAEKIRETADYYMTDFLDFNHFWEFASKKHL
ncbi:MAG TPA: HAD family hydrolase, partial [Lachnospiraceae bacterium]|nr:HAD family hydrolase [Lachnospiraceae bacterium]